MRAPRIRVRIRGQEPSCFSVTQLQAEGLPAEGGTGEEVLSPEPSPFHTPKHRTRQSTPRTCVQLTLHREAEGNVLGAQRVLSLAGEFPFIFHPCMGQLQDP